MQLHHRLTSILHRSTLATTLLILFCHTLIFANNIDVGFSPNQGSLPLVLKTINSAQKSLCMATYSFTSRPVVEALIAAKNRGVDIKIVSDEKANSNDAEQTQ